MCAAISVTKADAQIDFGMYGTAVIGLIEYSIDFQCQVINLVPFWDMAIYIICVIHHLRFYLSQLMIKIGNDKANQLLEHKMPEDDKISPSVDSYVFAVN